MTGHVAVAEVAVTSHVLVVEEILVRPGEIKRQGQRATHADVLEQFPPGIENKSLHTGIVVFSQVALDDSPVIEFLPVVIACPGLGIVFQHKLDLACLQGFERHAQVLVILERDLVEVVHAARRILTLGPVVLSPFIRNVFAELIFLDAIRAGTDR